MLKHYKNIAFALVIVLFSCSVSASADRLKLQDIEQDKIIAETLRTPLSNTPSNMISMVWWIPPEFWAAGEEMPQEIMDLLPDTNCFVVVAAQISDLGSVSWYSETEIKTNLEISYKSGEGAFRKLRPGKDPSTNMQLMVEILEPFLSSVMGAMGENMVLLVVPKNNKLGERQPDPYSKGTLSLQFATRDDLLLRSVIELPLDSLHVPRKCPNGKDAHISWSFCPWTGKPLPE